MSAIAKPKTAPAYSEAQTTRWLSWLAYQLKRHDQTVFLIENLQPSWLGTDKKRRYFIWFMDFFTIFLVLFVPVLETIIVMLFEDLGLSDIAIAFILIIPISLICWMIWQLYKIIRGLLHQKLIMSPYINPVESIGFSLKRVIAATILLILGIFFLTMLVVLLLGEDLELGFAFGIFAVLLIGTPSILFGLYWGLKPGNIEVKSKPNQGIFSSAKYAGISFTVVVLLTIVSYVFIDQIEYSALLIPVLGWFGVLRLGGSALLRHLVLRFILLQQGHIPINYARFLNYAADELNFLQKVGGGYIFVHRYLLEHFAAIEEEKRKEAPSSAV